MKSEYPIRVRPFLFTIVIIAGLLHRAVSWAQVPNKGEAPSPQPAAAPENPLGRTSPRDTVLGFLSATRKGDFDTAAEYLNTRQRGRAAATLAEQLAFVLDRRLPARLNELTSDPEGSRSTSVNAGQELVGTISSLDGSVDILLERVTRGKSGQIWLFSKQTLAAVPDLYDEVSAISVDAVLPEVLLKRFLGIILYAWLSFFIGLPLVYLLLSLLNRVLGALVGWALRRVWKTAPNPNLIPPALRLLLIALTIRWSLSKISLPLLSRQFWASGSVVIAIIAFVWLFMMVSARFETHVKRRFARRSSTGAATLVRPARRVIDLIAAFVGLLLALCAFGVNPTAALAGLGVGGIAIALAAQKTLENVIGGASIIMDQAIRAGDFLKVGDIQGTVEEVGLRSTRVRTLDRTLVSVPNRQMASMTLENFAFRDHFWFHPHHRITLRDQSI